MSGTARPNNHRTRISNEVGTAAARQLVEQFDTFRSDRISNGLIDISFGPQGGKPRMEFLDLDNEADRQRWQVIHGDTERYRLLYEKDATGYGRAGAHRTKIVYIELGDNLPLYKTTAELRKDDMKRMLASGVVFDEELDTSMDDDLDGDEDE